MNQLSLGLDLPSHGETQHRTALAALPEGDGALIESVRALLPAYNAASVAADTTEMNAIHDQIDRIAEKLNGGTRFAIVTDEGAYGRLRAALSASDGTEPMWGQPGRFIVHACGCRCVVSYKGLFGFGGFEIRAVDFGRPFISETGFRSFSGFDCKRQPGETLAQRVVREIERDFGVHKHKLRRMGSDAVWHNVKPDLDDPAWQPGGWLHEAAKNPPALTMEA